MWFRNSICTCPKSVVCNWVVVIWCCCSYAMFIYSFIQFLHWSLAPLSQHQGTNRRPLTRITQLNYVCMCCLMSGAWHPVVVIVSLLHTYFRLWFCTLMKPLFFSLDMSLRSLLLLTIWYLLIESRNVTYSYLFLCLFVSCENLSHWQSYHIN